MRNKFLLLLLLTLTFKVLAQQTTDSVSTSKPKTLKQQFPIQTRFGGFIMMDHAFFSQDDALDTSFGELTTKNATEIRRARLYAIGTVYQNVNFKLDLAFEGGNVRMRDLFIGIKNIPVIGTLRVGYVKEPIRLEILNSARFITFLERSFLLDYLPIRNSGILMLNDFKNKRVSYQAGFFRNANGVGNDLTANDGYVFTGRISGLPLMDHEHKKLLHIGLSYSYRKPDTENYSISSKPEANLSSIEYINTGIIENVDVISMLNFEGALVSGAFSTQAEYMTTKVNSENTYTFTSYYGQVSYFLTGEYKKYHSSYLGFGRVYPKANFGGNSKGAGAWEIALRYSRSDLNSKDILGGEQSNISLGLSWYLNPATRIMFNHIWEDIKDVGTGTIIQMRFQIDF